MIVPRKGIVGLTSILNCPCNCFLPFGLLIDIEYFLSLSSLVLSKMLESSPCNFSNAKHFLSDIEFEVTSIATTFMNSVWSLEVKDLIEESRIWSFGITQQSFLISDYILFLPHLPDHLVSKRSMHEIVVHGKISQHEFTLVFRVGISWRFIETCLLRNFQWTPSLLSSYRG